MTLSFSQPATSQPATSFSPEVRSFAGAPQPSKNNTTKKVILVAIIVLSSIFMLSGFTLVGSGLAGIAAAPIALGALIGLSVGAAVTSIVYLSAKKSGEMGAREKYQIGNIENEVTQLGMECLANNPH